MKKILDARRQRYVARAATFLSVVALLAELPHMRERFWRDVRVPGSAASLNVALEKAGRVADFLDLAEVLCRDALTSDESAGAHFRIEHQTPAGEAVRNDEEFRHVAVWEFRGDGAPPIRHQEPLAFENVALATRSYK